MVSYVFFRGFLNVLHDRNYMHRVSFLITVNQQRKSEPWKVLSHRLRHLPNELHVPNWKLNNATTVVMHSTKRLYLNAVFEKRFST